MRVWILIFAAMLGLSACQWGETGHQKPDINTDTLALTYDTIKNHFFKGDKFALNDNYLITPLGIRFLYNPYEIKPYAAGTTDLFIPYDKIKSLLRPNTVITQYIK